MYEAVHAHPDGDSTVARMAATAADYGFEGILIRNSGDASAAFDRSAVHQTYGIDVVEGVEITAADPAQASGYLGTHRPGTAIVCLRGDSVDLNRFAVGQERIDVLSHPMADGDLNHVMVRAAKANGVRLEVDFAPALRAQGGRRVRALSGLRKLRELIEAYDAPFVVSGDPRSHLELRAPRELRAVGETIGFDPDAIEAGLAEWGRIAAENRERHADGFVEPGVRRGRYDDSSAGGADARSGPGEQEP